MSGCVIIVLILLVIYFITTYPTVALLLALVTVGLIVLTSVRAGNKRKAFLQSQEAYIAAHAFTVDKVINGADNTRILFDFGAERLLYADGRAGTISEIPFAGLESMNIRTDTENKSHIIQLVLYFNDKVRPIQEITFYNGTGGTGTPAYKNSMKAAEEVRMSLNVALRERAAPATTAPAAPAGTSGAQAVPTVRAVNCPGCGAAATVAAGQTTQCQYCGGTITG